MGILHVKIAKGAELVIYPKPNHTPATYTMLNFPVSEIEATVDELTLTIYDKDPD